jgi:glutathione reductase (NADPH)
MNKEYDLVVIGTGTAASVAATRIRAAGWKVAVIDHRPFGGTCALRGCDPKKMLIGGTSAIDRVRKMHGKGVTGDSRIDWRDLMAFKRTFTDPVPQAKEQGFADKGIDAYHGVARFYRSEFDSCGRSRNTRCQAHVARIRRRTGTARYSR